MPEPGAVAPVEVAPVDSEAAFSEHVLPEIEVLYRVARSMTRHSQDAEDLVQDTLLRAYRSIDGFDGRHPRAWLLTIMRNAQVNRVRRRRPGLLDDPDAAVDRASSMAEPEPGPEERVMDRQIDESLEEAYRALPEKFREVVDLVDLSDLSYAEAATLLEIPVGTVMSRLHRARKRMRDALGGKVSRRENGKVSRGGKTS